MFLCAGQAGARMQEIADAAGINKALLHYYFRSKERLYRTVLEREIAAFLRGVVGSIPETDDIEAFLRGMIGTIIDRLAGNPQVVRFITWELGRGGPVAREVIRGVIMEGSGESVYNRFRGLVAREVARKRIRPVDPDHLLFSVLGMCLYVYLAAPILSAVYPGVDPGDATFAEKRKDEVFELAWRGIRAGKEAGDA